MDKIRWISPWNPPDFICKWGNLHMKSAGFHEICRISYVNEAICIWNPPNFMHEICQISWNLLDFRAWNPPDFMMKSAEFHAWNPADFMKFGGFHEIQMSQGPMVLFFIARWQDCLINVCDSQSHILNLVPASGFYTDILAAIVDRRKGVWKCYTFKHNPNFHLHKSLLWGKKHLH